MNPPPKRPQVILIGALTACALTACSGAPVPAPAPSPTVSLTGSSASPSPTPTPTPTPKPLTLPDIAPGLQPRQTSFTLPRSTRPAGKPVTVQVAAAKPGQFRTTSVGLSFEAQDLADERWDPDSSTLDELIKPLDRPSLRFGGNSVDRRVWWTSKKEPAPKWAKATVTPADLERLSRFATRVDATVTLVVDLGHNDPQRAADYVWYAQKYLGTRLVAISVGNEPNGFYLDTQPQYAVRDKNWTPTAFVTQLKTYAKAIRARVPGVALIGPGAFDAPWWRAFAESWLPNTPALSQHWYPLWACKPEQIAKEKRATPTIANITSPWLHQRAAFILGMGKQTANDYGKAHWMEETGPTSCMGTNETSRTHAQALWTSDITLHAATLGVQRLNHHGMIDACKGGAPMSPTCATGQLGAGSPVVTGQSNYLSLLQLAELREGPMRLVLVSGNPSVFAYAIEDAKGIDLVLVNMNDPAKVGASAVTVSGLKGLRVTHASLLTADKLEVRTTSLTPLSPAKAMPAAVPAGSVLAVRLVK